MRYQSDRKNMSVKTKAKHCYFCREKIDEVDYQNTQLLVKFLSYLGKIEPRAKTGLCGLHQRKLAKAIKQARELGLLAFVQK